MERNEQIDALEDEITKVIHRFDQEFDLDAVHVVWVLEQVKQSYVDVEIEFEADMEFPDDSEDDPA